MLTYFVQNEDYRLRFAVSEWRKIEYELTRERGLWGPENPSELDKWMLDTVEGTCRHVMNFMNIHRVEYTYDILLYDVFVFFCTYFQDPAG